MLITFFAKATHRLPLISFFWGGEFRHRQESGSRPQGDIQAETQQSTSEEEESDEEGEDAQPGSETPAKPGLLSRLARFVEGR